MRMLCAATALLCSGTALSFEHVESNITLDAKNYYMHRSYINESRLGYPSFNGQPKPQSVEWGQGLVLGAQSSARHGDFNFGARVYGEGVFQLDSSQRNYGTGLMVYDSISGETERTSGRAGGTVTLGWRDATLTHGSHHPMLPVAYRSDARLFLQSFWGTQLQVKSIPHTTLTAGQFESTKLRSSTGSEKMEMFSSGATGGVESNEFNYAGIEFQPLPILKMTYFYGELKNNYSQHHIGLHGGLPLGPVRMRADAMYFDSHAEGNTNVDNRTLITRVSGSWAGHTLAGMWQQQEGRTGMPFIAGGTSPYSFNGVTFHHFLHANEDAWQVRYDYDFKQLGIPGLTLMTRYVKGKNFTAYGRSGDEWERDTDVTYAFQQPKLKGLNVQYRNVSHRSDVLLGVDDHRLIVEYATVLW